VLTLVNDGGGGHSFSAKEFFAAAGVRPDDAALLKNGAVEVAGNASVVLHFRAPAAGAYKVKCTHAFHSGFGMKGEIVVR
jgi:plastocyanin